MNRESIIKKALFKLSKVDKMDNNEVEEIIFDKFIEKEEILKSNYKKKKMISNEEHDLLRKIYDSAPVKKLYTYSLGRFGFIYDKIRFDVEPASVDIKKL